MDSYLELPICNHVPDTVAPIIEVSGDSVNKYEYNPNPKVFALDRLLHPPVHFPGDYGFIPQTMAPDSDPLAILAPGDTLVFPGTEYNARSIGLFVMLDRGVCDEKILVYSTANPRFREIEKYAQVQKHIPGSGAFLFRIQGCCREADEGDWMEGSRGCV